MNARDIYQQIADTLIARLDQCQPYQRPWLTSNTTAMPANATTGRTYRGSNVVMLWMAADAAGYTDARWATFQQWKERGAIVRKGEKGTPILWFSLIDRKHASTDAESGDTDPSGKIPCARISHVFNIAQVDGADLTTPAAASSNVSFIEAAEHLVVSTQATIRHGGNAAYYRRSTDHIQMPPREAFTGTATMTATEAYYATLLHELVHWTAPRLDRELGKRFGDDAYAAEELVAELGAAFLTCRLGISATPRDDHAAYLASWSTLLRKDPRAFVTASSKAADAAEFLVNCAATPALEAA